ncbi:MAG: hypothetical protein AAF432_14800 [Planctomycetota bacterium]
MVRRVRTIILFLLLGAVINVAVAWGIAYTAPAVEAVNSLIEIGPGDELYHARPEFVRRGFSAIVVERDRGTVHWHVVSVNLKMHVRTASDWAIKNRRPFKELRSATL